MRIPGVATVAVVSVLVCVAWGATSQENVLIETSEPLNITHPTPSGEVKTLIYVPAGEAQTETTAAHDDAKIKAPHGKLSVFYPPRGEGQVFGRCWQSVAVDAAGNVYPLGSGQVSKLTPE